ncbi:putative toxin-antitoxin system toxin component, PIN family [Chlorobium sp. KB01]|uniref:putative toxin-antitoxin system toxin component, PIN family n=1 Tax=Chlorobium sp. KB01 TaxID=1917528 RepID=UPI00097876A0
MSCRIVLDTNCIISGLIFSRRKMAWLRHSWQSGAIIPLVCKETASELLKVLAYPKFRLTNRERMSLLSDFLPYAETVTLLDVSPDLPVIRDKADQIFITLAVVGKADALVTGDNDLLVIKDSFKTLPIMSLSELEEWLKR